MSISKLLAIISAAILFWTLVSDAPFVYRYTTNPEHNDYLSLYIWLSVSLFGLKFTFLPSIVKSKFTKPNPLYFSLFLVLSLIIVMKTSDKIAVAINSTEVSKEEVKIEFLNQPYKVKLLNQLSEIIVTTQVCRNTYKKIRDLKKKSLVIETGKSFGMSYVKTPCLD